MYDYEELINCFNAVVEHAEITCWEYNYEKRQMKISDSSLRMEGVSRFLEDVPDSIVKQGFVFEESAEVFLNMCNRMEEGSEKESAVIKIRSWNRRGWKWIKLTLVNVYNDAGEPIMSRGFSTDIKVSSTLEVILNGIFDHKYEYLGNVNLETGKYKEYSRYNIKNGEYEAIHGDFNGELEEMLDHHQTRFVGEEGLTLPITEYIAGKLQEKSEYSTLEWIKRKDMEDERLVCMTYWYADAEHKNMSYLREDVTDLYDKFRES